jgi:serine/threonine protein kinase
MLNQTKYKQINPIQSSLTDQSMMVECPNRPHDTGILYSYATERSKILLELGQEQIDRLLLLRHPHLQPLIDIFDEDDSIHIVQGAVQGKPIGTQIPLPEYLCEKLLKETLEVITYLHGQGVVHGNISPESILITSENKFILTSFQSINNLIIAANGTVPISIVKQLTKISVANLPKGERFDLYTLGLTVIHLLTDRDLNYLYNPTTQQWQWERESIYSRKLVRTIDRLIGSQPIVVAEILAELSPQPSRSDDPLPLIDDPFVDRTPSTFIDLPDDLQDPVYLQTGILGFLFGLIWIFLHNLIPWGSIGTGLFGMTISGIIYYHYRSPFQTRHLVSAAGVLCILIMTVSPLHQKLPIFDKSDPDLFSILLFAIACGLFYFASVILAKFIYQLLSIFLNND